MYHISSKFLFSPINFFILKEEDDIKIQLYTYFNGLVFNFLLYDHTIGLAFRTLGNLTLKRQTNKNILKSYSPFTHLCALDKMKKMF